MKFIKSKWGMHIGTQWAIRNSGLMLRGLTFSLVADEFSVLMSQYRLLLFLMCSRQGYYSTLLLRRPSIRSRLAMQMPILLAECHHGPAFFLQKYWCLVTEHKTPLCKQSGGLLKYYNYPHCSSKAALSFFNIKTFFLLNVAVLTIVFCKWSILQHSH